MLYALMNRVSFFVYLRLIFRGTRDILVEIEGSSYAFIEATFLISAREQVLVIVSKRISPDKPQQTWLLNSKQSK